MPRPTHELIDGWQDDSPTSGASLRQTAVVLVLLVITALVFSYLAAYAMANALAAADVIARWPPAADPRPRWMMEIFSGLLGGFIVIGGSFRYLSRRQMRKIDAMEEG